MFSEFNILPTEIFHQAILFLHILRHYLQGFAGVLFSDWATANPLSARNGYYTASKCSSICHLTACYSKHKRRV